MRGHRRAELAKRADTSGRATFARCATGAGVALHVPAKALRFAHPRPLERYTLTLDVRLDRLPAPRAHAALVCLNPAGPRRRASLYVDADGALARPRDVEGDGAVHGIGAASKMYLHVGDLKGAPVAATAKRSRNLVYCHGVADGAAAKLVRDVATPSSLRRDTITHHLPEGAPQEL